MAYKHSIETRIKMSKSHMGLIPWNKGRKCPEISEAKKGYCPTEETRRKISIASIARGAKPPSWLGKHHTKETKEKIGKGNLGKKLSQEAREKIRQSKLGKPTWNKGLTDIYSEETLKKMSEKAKLRFADKKNHPMYGKHLSEEQKRNLRIKNTGKHLSDETKEKIRQANIGRAGTKSNLGKHFSLEHRRKLSEAHIGEKAYHWKGGVTPLSRAIRGLFEYKEWRKAIYKRDDWTCQECGARSKAKAKISLRAHHKKDFFILLAEFLKEYDQFSPYEDQHTLLRLATKWLPFWEAEGITLCKDCHNNKHKELNLFKNYGRK
jgi:hypothetical protein